jgi:Bacterial regulatory proteins, lacI family/Periplasmic binding protein domain
MAIQKSSAPTIIDVAELAGVSRATASRAMGNYGRIAAATVEQVRKAAAELGYRPNEVARAMRQGRTKTIGLVIIADFTNAFFDRATKAIVDAAKARGYQVLITNTDEDIAAERQAIETLVDKQVDGLIVVPSTAAVHDHLATIQKSGKPLVLLDRRVDGIIATSITTDDLTGAPRLCNGPSPLRILGYRSRQLRALKRSPSSSNFFGRGSRERFLECLRRPRHQTEATELDVLRRQPERPADRGRNVARSVEGAIRDYCLEQRHGIGVVEDRGKPKDGNWPRHLANHLR